MSGPCVCGDPCWIGPQGNGCDYALYTPESKQALLANRELLVAQIEALEQKHPQHSRLGQWKTRLGRLDQVLNEIETAELRANAGECPERPRAQVIPQDPPLEPSLPPIPAQRAMLQRRREAAKKGGFKRKNDPGPLQELDGQTLARGRSILDEFASIKATLTPREFARRLGVPVNTLYQNTYLCESLSQHNKECFASIEETMSARLEELRMRGEAVSQTKFLELCGISRSMFSHSFPAWINKLKQHNKYILGCQRRARVEQHLQEILAAGRGRSRRNFASDMRMALRTLMKEYPDVVRTLVQHNKAVGLNHAWTERARCEKIAIIYECWYKALREGKLISLTQFSETHGISLIIIRTLCPELIAQFHRENTVYNTIYTIEPKLLSGALLVSSNGSMSRHLLANLRLGWASQWEY